MRPFIMVKERAIPVGKITMVRYYPTFALDDDDGEGPAACFVILQDGNQVVVNGEIAERLWKALKAHSIVIE